MFMKFEILSGVTTLTGTVSGSRGDWTVRVPGNVTKENQTTEKLWLALFNEMVSAAFESANRRRHPERHREAV
jgi:hypothetical protein